MADNKQRAVVLKDKGNAFLKAENYSDAIECYSQGIKLDESNHILYSNRSAAYCNVGKYVDALKDAEKVVSLKPDWPKGYSRQGTALQYLKRYEEAKLVYDEGLKLDPGNKQMMDGVKESESKLTGPAGSSEFDNPFKDPQLIEKLENHPKTSEWMKEPDYRSLIEALKANPTDTGKLGDPRILETLGALLGFEVSENGDDSGLSNGTASSQTKKTASKASQVKKDGPTKPTEGTAESSPKPKAPAAENAQALEEKEKGNAAYRAKEFDQALDHYGKAIELDPTNVAFYTNKAAVYFEKHEYDECVKVCEKAIEVGRENRADYKVIAKAFARMGNAYNKQKNYQEALKYFNKSLSEYRDPDINKKVTEIKKIVKEQERVAYLDPEKAEEAKQKGNDFFKQGNYPESMKHYDEAIKRNPNDHKLYSNRAACLTKLLDFRRALEDSEKCIQLDPTFVKGYLRKGTSLQGMGQYIKAISAFEEAKKLDPNVSEEAFAGISKCRELHRSQPRDQKVSEQGLNDPEIQEILSDPGMQFILQQMQQNPMSVRDHLKNPDISAKFQKLVDAGFVDVR
ncbi:stress-induced-phosphoprotein 1-like isoform X2 [Lineus longissimus]|uniref:stress-induced-phosphoprotein 1-like isoform X2 n=1 Tax=Lineus longissimus TaxID=88925 RepID=UPI00315CF7B6